MLTARPTVDSDLRLLQITAASIESTLNSIPHTSELWSKRTEAFHNLIKSARKSELRKWHPDTCKDSNAVERSQEINAAADRLLTVTLAPPPPPQPTYQIVTIRFGGFNTWTSTTTTTGSWF